MNQLWPGWQSDLPAALTPQGFKAQGTMGRGAPQGLGLMHPGHTRECKQDKGSFLKVGRGRTREELRARTKQCSAPGGTD